MRFIVDDSLPRLEYNTALQDHLNLSLYILSFICVYTFILCQAHKLVPGFTEAMAETLDRMGMVTSAGLLVCSLMHLAWLRLAHKKNRPMDEVAAAVNALGDC